LKARAGTPAWTKLYWSVRMKELRSGSGRGRFRCCVGTDGAGLIGEGGLFEALDVEFFEGKDGHEHVEVQVGDESRSGTVGCWA